MEMCPLCNKNVIHHLITKPTTGEPGDTGALFVRRATAGNVSASGIYTNNPSINDSPEVGLAFTTTIR